MSHPGTAARSARTYAFLSLGTAIITIALKLVAYWLTDSVGLLSDALESIVNLVAAVVAIWALTLASRPPDDEHAYGHSKAEYFSSGAESVMILIAAAGIIFTAVNRLIAPRPIENVGIGLIISALAAGFNGAVALVLLRAGRRLDSITLRADAHHLLTDVWTSLGVVVGVLLVGLTGWLPLDPVIAIVVALNIVWAGWRLLRETANGLLDIGLPSAAQQQIMEVLAGFKQDGITFHALRTRIAGQRRFVSMHILVPGEWTVQRGHMLCEEVERGIRAKLPHSTVFTHLEPLEDAISWADQALDRAEEPESSAIV
jgi:cation diffusion facilitator family transporter